MLLGDILRSRGQGEAARAAFAYETATLQDMQNWLWHRVITPLSSTLDVGNGLDLGMIQGFTAPLPNTHWRWTTGYANIRLAPPTTTPATLTLRLASGRPPTVPPTKMTITLPVGNQHPLIVGSAWQEYTLPLDEGSIILSNRRGAFVITLHSATFTPRDDDPTSDDGRVLGVMVDWVRVAGEEQ